MGYTMAHAPEAVVSHLLGMTFMVMAMMKLVCVHERAYATILRCMLMSYSELGSSSAIQKLLYFFSFFLYYRQHWCISTIAFTIQIITIMIWKIILVARAIGQSSSSSYGWGWGRAMKLVHLAGDMSSVGHVYSIDRCPTLEHWQTEVVIWSQLFLVPFGPSRDNLVHHRWWTLGRQVGGVKSNKSLQLKHGEGYFSHNRWWKIINTNVDNEMFFWLKTLGNDVITHEKLERCNYIWE